MSAARLHAALARRVTQSMDVPHEALPVLALLFAGIDALGTSPRRAAAWLRDAGIGPRDCVLDMGCGKGGPAVAVARACGCRVIGVDAFAPFIDAAREHAARARVAARCEFVCADVRTWKNASGVTPRAGMMLSLFPATESIKFLANYVRPGGFVLTDDAVRVPGIGEDAALPLSRDELCDTIISQGHRVLRAHVMSPGEVTRLDDRLYATIRRNANAISRTHPSLKPLLREVLRRQRDAHALLTGPIRPALLLVQLSR